MRKFLFIVIAFLYIFFAATTAQENQTPPQDLCSGVTCNPATITCPDGFVSSCSNACDASTGKCSQCTPSCAGHEAKPTQTEPQPTQQCPSPPSAPDCPSGSLQSRFDDKGCITGYECTPPQPTQQCPQPPSPVSCPQNQFVDTKFDDNKCIIGYECKSFEGAPPRFCGNGICEENEENCPNDCIDARQTCPATQACPDGSTVSCRQVDERCSCDACPLPVALPPGCRQDVNKETGFVKVVCETVCPQIQIPPEAEQKCSEHGGRFVTKTDVNGCNVFDCVFEKPPALLSTEKATCPTPEKVRADIEGCREIGMVGVVAFEGGCGIGKCIQEQRRICAEDENPSIRKDIVERCESEDGLVVKDFDPQGCPITRCEPRNFCPPPPPREAFERCGEDGGQLVVRQDEHGCASFVKCVFKSDVRASYVEPPKQLPDVSDLIQLAFKLEELKIALAEMSDKANDIANFYKSRGESDSARFERVADMFDAAEDVVDDLKDKIRGLAKSDISIDDVIDLREEVRRIKDLTLKDILFVMLGEDEEIEDIEKGESSDCGSDDECFGRAFRLCNKVTFRPEGRHGPVIEIRGLEGDECVMHAEFPEGEGPPAGIIPGVNPPYEMTCRTPKYALGIRGPEDILPYCSGSMVELMKRFGPQEQFPPAGGGPGGCTSERTCAQYCLENYEDCTVWTKEHGSGLPPPRDVLERIAKGEFSRQAPGIPGKCIGEECRDYCVSSPEAARECIEHFGTMLPAEAREGLERFARGESEFAQGFGRQPEFREESGEGKFEERFERREFERREFEKREFEPREFPGFRQPAPAPRPGPVEACSGCLDNGVCDPGECSFCGDCSG